MNRWRAQLLALTIAAFSAAWMLAEQRKPRRRPEDDSGMPKWREQLRAELEQLATELNGYRVDLEHFVPDVMLNSYGLDVLEQGRAVFTLTGEIEHGRAAFASSRTAFESCLDTLLLVSDAAHYDRYGSLARAYELLEHEELRDRRTKADEATSQETEPVPQLTDLLEADAERWDGYSAGKGDVLRQSFADAKEQRRRRVSHWSGLNASKRRKVLAVAFSKEPGFPEMADWFYGLLSVHRHPSPRTGFRNIEMNEQGQLAYSPNAEDAQSAANLTQAAVHLTRTALATRKKLFTSST